MSNKKSPHAHPKHRAPAPSSPLTAILAGLLSFPITCVPLILIGAAICSNVADPDLVLFPLSLASSLLSALLSGLIAAKKRGECIIPTGLLVGVILFVFTFLLAFLLPHNGTSAFRFPHSLLLRLLIPLFSTLGALIGGNQRSEKRNRR